MERVAGGNGTQWSTFVDGQALIDHQQLGFDSGEYIAAGGEFHNSHDPGWAGYAYGEYGCVLNVTCSDTVKRWGYTLAVAPASNDWNGITSPDGTSNTDACWDLGSFPQPFVIHHDYSHC